MKTVAIVSGGMDSVTLAYHLKGFGEDLHILSFDYGQRHRKELQAASKVAERLKVPHDIIDLRKIGEHLSGSALTDNIEVPEGHYAAENMAVTVVPNRNAIMLSVAFGVAVSLKADRVAFGVHAGDHFIYPDCRPNFIKAFDLMEGIATEGFSQPGLHLYAPFANITKADIVRIGTAIDVPYEITWSCYKGGEVQCGRCGTCVERKEAFRLAEVPDPTPYEDEVFEIAAYRG